ncbi:MAG: hypothetical protein M1833_006732 [Piccolia ochrophora]|nr:MAG: hypothetical protein M1833_006732 [Piccolia ochrophora]
MYFSTTLAASFVLANALTFASPIMEERDTPMGNTPDAILAQLYPDGSIGAPSKRAVPDTVAAQADPNENSGNHTRRDTFMITRGWEDFPEATRRQLQDMVNGPKEGGIERRDERFNCGNGNAANGRWVPFELYNDGAVNFCGRFTGEGNALLCGFPHSDNRQIKNGVGWASMVFNTDCTKQESGDFKDMMHNTELCPSGYISYDDCLDYIGKQSNPESKCWGDKHKDTKGGMWTVDGFGIIGGLIGNGHVTE